MPKTLERCRGCDGSFWWALTNRKGKFIPLDPDPTPEGTFYLTGEQRASENRGWFPEVAFSPQHLGDRYAPHFATCPGAKFFSKDRARRARDRALEKGRRT